MKSLEEFNESIKEDMPNSSFSLPLKALWYDAKGNWNQAHKLIDQETDKSSAWVHAYLHRKEGDIWNADYWYRKANKTRPNLSLDKEWENLVLSFLMEK